MSETILEMTTPLLTTWTPPISPPKAKKCRRELINAEKVDGQAIVSIKDAGTGIDPEIMPRLFEKFASKSFSGTGLGLYLCKSIVEAHGGKIWAENNIDGKDGKGGGAIFTFTIPISKENSIMRKSEVNQLVTKQWVITLTFKIGLEEDIVCLER